MPLEIRAKKKNGCIDIKEIEHEGGESMEREKSVGKKEKDEKKREIRRKRDGLSKCSSTQVQGCEFPGKIA